MISAVLSVFSCYHFHAHIYQRKRLLYWIQHSNTHIIRIRLLHSTGRHFLILKHVLLDEVDFDKCSHKTSLSIYFFPRRVIIFVLSLSLLSSLLYLYVKCYNIKHEWLTGEIKLSLYRLESPLDSVLFLVYMSDKATLFRFLDKSHFYPII